MPKDAGKLIRDCDLTRPTQVPDTPASSCCLTDPRPYVKVRIHGREFEALIDTGAVKSYLGDNIARYCEQLGIEPEKAPVGLARLADGRFSETPTAYRIKLRMLGTDITELIYHLPNLSSELILGMDILRGNNVKLELGSNIVRIDHPDHEPQLASVDNGSAGEMRADEELSADERKRLDEFLQRELKVLEDIQGTTPLIQHEIKLIDHQPIKQRYRPQNPKMQEIINVEVNKMLAGGIIEPSNSPWSSPIVMVRKKDNTFRFCIDFQKINERSQKDAYPLPFINAILDKLRKARYISTIDLKQGYWQVPLTESSKPITAFTVPGRGLFQFKVMPFGLHAAPATFQRLMDRVIGEDLDYCFAYLDDLIVLGTTFEEHLRNLKEVFRRLKAANLRLNPEKCQFGKRSLKYLGHLVTPQGIRTDPDKVAAILTIPAPTNVRALRRFLGVASWYRRFVKNFSQIAAPLNKLLKKKSRWQWNQEQEQAFDTLKNCLTQAPVLTCPDFTRPFILQTDASDRGIGVALIQNHSDGDHVIAYGSRTLTATEKKYSVTEKECAAIVWGIEKMRPYLEGYHFTVVTDHQSLKWLHSMKSPSGRIARWAMYLQQFSFDIKYRKGVLNKIADALSREPLSTSNKEEELDPLCIVDGAPFTCPWYAAKKAAVLANPKAFPDYCIRNDRLYRHFFDVSDSTETEFSDPWKLCVPKPMRDQVMKENHDLPTAGHLGIAKTSARIALRYYWPGMFRDTAKYVRSCFSCQKYKTLQSQLPGKMHPSKNSAPWDTVSTDLIGPLPRSSRQNSYLVMFQDRFTKWTVCRPIRKATSKAVTQAFYEDVIMRFGCPNTVITDNGTQYTGQPFKVLLEELGIQHRLTPPYTPQANPVERTNKTTKTMIAQMCETDQRKWDSCLPELMFALNTARHDSTGFTPALLNFGRELQPPRGLFKETQSEESKEPSQGEIEKYSGRIKRIAETYELVRVQLGRAFTNQSKHYNLRRREVKYHVGDKVYKKEHTLSSATKGVANKLSPKFSGPHTVTRVISPVVYDLKSGTGKVFRRIHIKDLKPGY